jgi:molybdate transport system regulatory protein
MHSTPSSAAADIYLKVYRRQENRLVGVTKRRTAPTLRLRIRVLREGEILMGPGKADLLDAIRRRGNLRAAAIDLEMSYMRAWKLVQLMNRSFREPLVHAERGGAGRGHAALTDAGEAILEAYREMERLGRAAAAPPFRRLLRRVKPAPGA